MTNLIMPMAGLGTRFKQLGLIVPKPILKINERYFFEIAVESITRHLEFSKMIFIIQKEHDEKFNLGSIILNRYPEAQVVPIPSVTRGTAQTVMKIKENTETKGPIFIADCDQFVESKKFTIVAAKLNNNLIDVAIPIFNSNREIYSYARVSKDDEVTEVAEKEVISSHAIAGVYGFQSFELFEDLYQSTKYDNSEEYISPVIQNAINRSLKVRAFQLEEHIPFGTPDEYRVAIRKL